AGSESKIIGRRKVKLNEKGGQLVRLLAPTLTRQTKRPPEGGLPAVLMKLKSGPANAPARRSRYPASWINLRDAGRWVESKELFNARSRTSVAQTTHNLGNSFQEDWNSFQIY